MNPPHQLNEPIFASALSATPGHIGVIMDGNRRWAREHRATIQAAYAVGAARLIEFLSWCDDAGVTTVTAWLINESNVTNRPAEEVSALLRVIEALMWGIVEQRRWRLAVTGDLSLLPDALSASCLRAVEATDGFNGPVLICGIGHSGRISIVAAIKALTVAASDVTPEAVTAHLAQNHQPELDLVIRSSGEQRMSDMSIWQAAWAELYFSDCLWPDYSRADFDRALDFYASRQRRFGG
ncbi:polyprenyl diphosphate synthase [Streptomyces vulcanius]|uniref:Isoprenyl transferase n=1 Tax=Streptomyces vulcanius TaxID=1441876 RepID=A0ABV9BBJ1_9ACTN